MTIELLKSVVPFRLKLASIRRPRCAKCNKKRTYLNPLAKCYKCGQKFCFDHINCLQVNNKMKNTDELREICDECKYEHEYKHWDDYKLKFQLSM